MEVRDDPTKNVLLMSSVGLMGLNLEFIHVLVVFVSIVIVSAADILVLFFLSPCGRA